MFNRAAYMVPPTFIKYLIFTVYICPGFVFDGLYASRRAMLPLKVKITLEHELHLLDREL